MGSVSYFPSISLPLNVMTIFHLVIHVVSFSLSPLQIARRCWSGHPLAKETLCAAMATQPKLLVTVPHEVASEDLLDSTLQ